MINRIAVLLTCFNRKDKTIACLHKLFEAYKVVENDIIIKVYLTDDASNDNTSEAVKRHFPEVIILEVVEIYFGLVELEIPGKRL